MDSASSLNNNIVSSTSHLVIPGQVIASSSIHNGEENSFLRGHGTYVERFEGQDRLVASVCGTVQRVNKLITVIPFATFQYNGQVGDLVVGRVVQVGNSRWNVSLVATSRPAALPLSGVHLPGGVQRVRTAQDQRDMRQFLTEGDLVSAEVHKVQPSDGSLVLHTRSIRYGKLENGCMVSVPPSLIPRRKNHSITVLDMLDVLWGMNGNIWIQRKLPDTTTTTTLASSSNNNNNNNASNITNTGGSTELAEVQEQLRIQHAQTPILHEERMAIARFKNAIECLRLVHCMVTPEYAEEIYKQSEAFQLKPFEMLIPENVIRLTQLTRKKG